MTFIFQAKQGKPYFGSDYNKNRFLEDLKRNDGARYRVVRLSPESKEARGYLEGGIIPAYCKWQYGIDPRDTGKSEQRRFLFKQDFHYDVIENRAHEVKRAPKSTKGQLKEVTNKYTDWALENGAPVPNTQLFKEWRDRFSLDVRFPSFYDFLEHLGLECDAMPSSEVIERI